MPLDTLPTFAVGAAQTVPTATDLNTIITAINSNPVDMIANGDFETGITGWIGTSDATLSHNLDDVAWSGVGCLEVTTPGVAAGEGVATASPIPVIEGQIYLAQAVFLTDDTHVVCLKISPDNAGSRILGKAQISTVTQTCMSGVFVVPPGCTGVDFDIRTENTAAGVFWVDELRFVLIGTIS